MLRICTAIAVWAGMVVSAFAQAGPNSDAAYQALRNPKLGSESLSLQNVVLKRDAATFTLSGTLCFVAPVEAKVTGAVFSGNGTFAMTPPMAVEQVSLSRLTGQPRIEERFESLVLRFTDATYEELKKAPGATSSTASCNADPLNDIGNALSKDIQWNLPARLLQDVYGTEPGGFFSAFIKGKNYTGKEWFLIDPHGALEFAPEEVAFLTWSENRNGAWAVFHLASEYASGKASGKEDNSVLKIDQQKVELNIEKGGKLQGKAAASLVARQAGVRVLPFNLYPTLRVSRVTDGDGNPLAFIQEDKNRDADFWVILPKPLAAGASYTIITSYDGKDALLSEGSGNFYLASGARDSWYPNSLHWSVASYDLRFSVPKDFSIVASGTPVKESVEGGQRISQWRSDESQTVAAFQLGAFKKDEKVVKGINLETYANAELPDRLEALRRQADNYIDGSQIATMSTVGMAKKAMAEAEIATQLYTDFFGPTPFKRLALTQQTADNYGQSWPELVWLPISYFLDDTQRHTLYGFDPTGYFRVVGPHEIAHQWWGHTVRWGSYRDQWMSEGFADMSASMFLQATRKSSEYIKFWDEERDMMLDKNRDGFRAIDVGPLTLGYRLNNSRVGSVTRSLIYPKGAYVAHMLRMMMWNPRTGDQTFKETMRDFVSTYRLQPATTEDFKAMVEKHLPRNLDLDGNGKLDWFFDEYVYGTALPRYHLEYSLRGLSLDIKLTQSSVTDNFKMIVPVYLELASGQVTRMGAVALKGNTSEAQTIDLSRMGLKDPPRRVMINYYDDVLCEKGT